MAEPSDSESVQLDIVLTADALAILDDAAQRQSQDLNSFVLGAALDRAREVIADDRSVRQDADPVAHLDHAMDTEPRNDQLAAPFRRLGI